MNEWQGFSVLVVDDDELFCSLLVSFCTRLGMPAQSVSHGSAFAAADLSEYDLLLLDLNMPGVDGVDIVQMIGDSNSSVGLVIISGEQIRTIDTVAAMARDAGLDLVSVLRKPVRFETFQEMLANWHARRRDRRIYQLDEPPIVELGMALEAGHVVAHFQPRADPMSMELVGVEAFARAPTLDGSVDAQRLNLTILQYPDVYELFSGAVQASALAFAETLRQRGMELRLTLNIAAQYLRDERLPERLRDDVLRHGVSPANVVLEMRAADLRAFANQVRPVLARLSLFGFEIALEDVDPLGGGQELQPGLGCTEVGIDVRVLREVIIAPRIRDQVMRFVERAHESDLLINLSRLETEADLALARELSADSVQGDLLGRPLPHDEALAVLLSWMPASGSH